MMDIEQYLLNIKAYLLANLNTYITALNSEKNDTVVLATLDSAAYFLQTFNGTIANYNPHMFIGVSDIQSQGIGPGTLKQLTFDVILIFEDRVQDIDVGIRLLRYGRILEEIFNRGFQKIMPGATFKVNSLVPISIVSVNTNDPYRAVGVQVVAALG